MATKIAWTLMTAMMAASAATAAEKSQKMVEHKMLMDHGAGHLMDMDGGMVMGQNKDKLPPGCSSISEDVTIEVHAGHKYAKEYPGTMFGFDKHEWRIKPCTRLTVNFINEDNVRHQWMMHGLPKFIYDKGMFHLEMTGPAKITGTLILPVEDKTYLIHCDIAQHMEKGMKGQLIVGKGGVPFPSIPGLTDPVIFDDYGPKVVDKPKPVVKTPPAGATATAGPANAVQGTESSTGTFIFGIILGVVGAPFAISWYRRRFEGMSNEEVLNSVVNTAKSTFDKLVGLIATLIGRLNKQ